MLIGSILKDPPLSVTLSGARVERNTNVLEFVQLLFLLCYLHCITKRQNYCHLMHF